MTTVVKLLKYGIFVLLQALAAQTYAGDKPYTITDGKVDENTFQGWQIYQEAGCGLCHGDSGQSPISNLSELLKAISKEQFVDSVTKGKGLMPPMITNKKVIDNIDKIYSYLKARSDGALGEGKPEKQ
jgi:mono/diheme cytochrome c family protein